MKRFFKLSHKLNNHNNNNNKDSKDSKGRNFNQTSKNKEIGIEIFMKMMKKMMRMVSIMINVDFIFHKYSKNSYYFEVI